MERITEFQGEYRFLSNFWMCPVNIEGIQFPSAEHAYVAAKNPSREWVRYVLSKQTPGEAKRIGRTATLRPDWEEVKLPFMEIILRAKFQNSDLAHMLCETAPREIIEGNRWRDTFWGVCLHTNQGENNLGKLLMKIRDELT
jgi:ribA/ribD-fused uncharacterized protein